MIYVNAAIGQGKTALTEILSSTLDSPSFYENVEDVPTLRAFYNEGEESRSNLSFPLQLDFLVYRFNQLNQAVKVRNAVMDSSLLSDSIMAQNLYDRGEFGYTEFDLYKRISGSMQSVVNGNTFDGYPDLVIFLDGSFDVMLEHIQKRGREMEVLDDDKIAYFKDVWKHYQDWNKGYVQSPKVVIDMNKYDFVNNMQDRKIVLTTILERMLELGMLRPSEYEKIKVDKLEKLV